MEMRVRMGRRCGMRQVLCSSCERIVVVVLATSMFFVLAYASKARAADSRWYVGANLPVMYIDDTDTTITGDSADHTMPMAPRTPYRAEAENKFDTGYKLEGFVGYELGSNFRIELEVFYAEADVDKLYYSGITTSHPVLGPQSVPGRKSIPISGTAEQMGASLNLWYDFDFGSKWIPYVGAGIGILEIDFGDVDYDDNALAQEVANHLAVLGAQALAAQAGRPPPPPEAVLMDPRLRLPEGHVPEISSTDTVVSYQFAAGVSYKFRENMLFRMVYRYQTSDDLKFDGSNASGTVSTKSDFEVQFLEVGIRYHF